MKKFLFFAVAAFGMLMTACSKDEVAQPVVGGEESVVTFTVEAPVMATRALGDGTTATQLFWAVYDKKHNLLFQSNEAIVMKELTATVEIPFVNGMAYNILFWAEAVQSPYSVDWANLEVGYKNQTLVSNSEKYDAFYCYFTELVDEITGPVTKTVELKRPFAQLNIITNDADKAEQSGVFVENVAVTVKKGYQAFDFVSGNGTNVGTVTFGSVAKQSNTTLAVNYLFTGGEKSLVDVVFSYTDVNNKVSAEGRTMEFATVPVQRNYRTNIVGSLLTSEGNFNIETKPGFEEYEHGYVVTEEGGQAVATVSTPSGLAQLAEDINDGKLDSDTNIVLDGDIDLSELAALTRAAVVSNWTPVGTSEKPYIGTFDGKGYTIKNLVIDGGSQSNIGFFGVTMNGEIKNVKFENAKVSGRFNVGVVAGTPYTSKYTNITVKGHVEVDGMAYVGAVGGKNAYANWTNVTVNVDETSYVNANSVENGTAYRSYVGGVVGFNGEGGHTFSNIYSNINVKGSTCDVGGLFGIAHYSNNFVNCVCEGDVEIYAASEEAEAQEIGGIAGVWHNENGTKVTFTNCSFTGKLKANNDYVINTNKFGNLVCSSYNSTGTGILVIDGTEYTLVDGNVVINGCTPVSTADELVAALEANKGVYLMNDIKIDPASMSNAYGATGINIKNGQTIDGGGHTLNIQGAGGTWDSGINTTGGIIRNITVTGSFRGIFINHTSTYSEKVVLENVTLTGVVYTISCDQGLYQGIEATNCTFNGWTSFAKTAGEAKFVNCSFGEGNGYKYCRPYSNTEFVNCTFCPGYAVDKTRATVTFTDCTWEK